MKSKKSSEKNKSAKKKRAKKADPLDSFELIITPEMVKQFTSEAYELLTTVEQALLKFSDNKEHDTLQLDEAFRAMHSFKGNCGFFGYGQLEKISHKFETAMECLKNGIELKDENPADFLLSLIDSLRDGVDDIENGGKGKINGVDGLVDLLNSMLPPPDVDTTISMISDNPNDANEDVESKEELVIDFSDASEDPQVKDDKPVKETANAKNDFAEDSLSKLSKLLEILNEKTDVDEIDLNDLETSLEIIVDIKIKSSTNGFNDIASLLEPFYKIFICLINKYAVDEEALTLMPSILESVKEALEDIIKDGKGKIKGFMGFVGLLDDMLPKDVDSSIYESPAKVKKDNSKPEKDKVEKKLKSKKEKKTKTKKLNYDVLETTFNLVAPRGEEIVDKFYNILFENHPEVKPLFANANMKEQKKHLLNALVLTINNIRKPDILLPVLEGLGVKHQGFGAKPEHYTVVKNVLLSVLADVAGDVWTSDINEEWDKALEFVSQVMINAKPIIENKIESKKEISKKTTDNENNKKSEPVTKIAQKRDIRVDVSKLDKLINLVGELVIAEAMVTKNPDLDGINLENFEKAAHGLNVITTDLQSVAMSIRMQPIEGVFKKMIRLVHDVSKKSNKSATLKLIGEDTEVDKNVIEMIGDPLVHIVRNCVDHGLETPEERLKLGKPEEGLITIEAKHEGGEVWIIVTDDGAGLDKEKILRKANEKNLVPNNKNLTDEEIYRLIFEPGFSTADKVSDVSGRGVGMDVVKRNIDKVKGRIDIDTKKGEYTKIFLRIPLTLAVIEGMIIRVGETKYTIPTISIIEFFRPDPKIITVLTDGQEVVKLRDELLPVVRLHNLHNITPDSKSLAEGILVVIYVRGTKICLFIDEVLGQQQTVVKGLSEFIGNVKSISGCTILGTGDISLILDVNSIVEYLD